MVTRILLLTKSKARPFIIYITLITQDDFELDQPTKQQRMREQTVPREDRVGCSGSDAIDLIRTPEPQSRRKIVKDFGFSVKK